MPLTRLVHMSAPRIGSGLCGSKEMLGRIDGFGPNCGIYLFFFILQCYHDTSQVTEELVDTILLPGLQPGAVDVFLEFICYSDGPLPEELLPQVKVGSLKKRGQDEI